MNKLHRKKCKRRKPTCLLQQLLQVIECERTITRKKKEGRLCTVYTLLYYLTSDNHILLIKNCKLNQLSINKIKQETEIA